jgi:hypothetical protein
MRTAERGVRPTLGRARGALGRVRETVRRDLGEDPYLAYVLLLSVLLCGFWLWHRAPTVATWDERDRLLDALVAYGSVAADPSLEGLREGVAWGRTPFGGTLYLYVLALAPVVLAAALVGQLGAVAAMADPDPAFGFVEVWRSTPEWLLTASLLAVRLVSVLAAVGSVYLTYRLGTALRDRATGRLAALLFGLTFEVVVLAHEGGEDLPALFALLLALYLLVRYVQAGGTGRFYAASAAGGVAMGLKLTAAPIAPTVLLAYVLRERGTEGAWWRGLWRARQLRLGAAVGAVVVLLSFPDVLVGNLYPVARRLVGQTGYRIVNPVGPDAPVWWWFLRGYASGFGWPLFVGVAAGTAIALWTLDREDDATALVAGCLGMFVILFAPWHDFRPHHLVPTMALLVLLGALGLVRLRRRHPTAGGLAVAALVVTAGLYAGVGAMQYADTPRQDARAWVEDHVPREATMESYQHGFEHAVAPTWPRMSYPNGGDPTGGKTVACPDYIQLVSEDLYYLRDAPPDERVRYTRTDTAARAGYVRGLLNGSRNYEVVATFGNPPDDYVVDRTEPGSLTDLLPLGVVPHSGRYGDEQELAGRQYVVILERTGPCEGERSPPW